ncbi:MAG: HAD family hydrolase [Firmicutes bacterium]|jgi:HAD superfamily hydrolase (TIGR01549 family)|nr:HAD family hydrolase [Bacillota bacterium]
MINTIFFDIDGTLLTIDKLSFHKEYSKRLCMYFSDMCSIDTMSGILKIGTMNMIKNDGSRSNKEAFTEHLRDIVGNDTDKYLERFDTFYMNEFNKLSIFGKEKVHMKESIEILKEKGYKLAIASNPMLPLEAMKHRVRWSGIDPANFDFISSFEDNNSTKASPLFYKEMISFMGKASAECLMVGDDIKEDMIASKVGVKTFLINEKDLSNSKTDVTIDYIGSTDKFLDFVKNLPSII